MVLVRDWFFNSPVPPISGSFIKLSPIRFLGMRLNPTNLVKNFPDVWEQDLRFKNIIIIILLNMGQVYVLQYIFFSMNQKLTMIYKQFILQGSIYIYQVFIQVIILDSANICIRNVNFNFSPQSCCNFLQW